MGTKTYGISHHIYRFYFQGRVLVERTSVARRIHVNTTALTYGDR